MLTALKEIRDRISGEPLTQDEKHRLAQSFTKLNSAGFDQWGVSPETLCDILTLFRRLYTDYFRVETLGIEKIPSGRVLLIANHGGQLPIDGLLVNMAVMLEGKPPRMCRAMVERWAPSVPFLGTFMNRCGQVVGNYRNCRELLEQDECVLVFPEGVRGSGKSIFERYRLQQFGTGFVRLALETNTPIVPVAVVGAEEIYPSFGNAEPLAKLFKAPYVPMTPLFPWLGLLGLFPMPCKVTLRFGDPIRFNGDPDQPEAEAQAMADQVKAAIDDELREGLRKRGGKIFTGAAR